MATTAHYSRLVIQQLAKRRMQDGTIERVDSVEIIEASGFKARNYAKAYGQAISLLDAACLVSKLPWIGRLVRFQKFKENLSGEWTVWAPYMPEILNAPLRKHWSHEHLEQITFALPTVGAATWWKSQAGNSKELLDSAILAARH